MPMIAPVVHVCLATLLALGAGGIMFMDAISVIGIPSLYVAMHRDCNEQIRGTVTALSAQDAFRCAVVVRTAAGWNVTVGGVGCRTLTHRLSDNVTIRYNHYSPSRCVHLVKMGHGQRGREFTPYSRQAWWLSAFLWCWAMTLALAACVGLVGYGDEAMTAVSDEP